MYYKVNMIIKVGNTEIKKDIGAYFKERFYAEEFAKMLNDDGKLKYNVEVF